MIDYNIIKAIARSVMGRRVRIGICRFILWILMLFRKRGTVILLYHSISPDSDTCIIADNKVSPENFEKQMRYIAKRKKVISLATFLDCIGKNKQPKDRIVITFDDGYRDNCEIAVPILKKYDLPATFFIATGLIDGASVFDKLNHLVMTTKRDKITISLDNGVNKEISLMNSEDRYAFVKNAIYLLENMAHERQLDFLKSISQLHGDTFNFEQYNPKVMMSWEECEMMSTYNDISFGVHTVSHANLAKLSLEEAKEEITISREELEAHIERQVAFFSYPHSKGSDSSIVKILRQCGFQCALTGGLGINKGNADLFRLKRFAVPNDSGLLFKFRLLGRTGFSNKLFTRIYVHAQGSNSECDAFYNAGMG